MRCTTRLLRMTLEPLGQKSVWIVSREPKKQTWEDRAELPDNRLTEIANLTEILELELNTIRSLTINLTQLISVTQSE